MIEAVLNKKTGRFQYNIPNTGKGRSYMELISLIRDRKAYIEDNIGLRPILMSIQLYPTNMVTIGLTINKLIKRRKEWNEKKYDWLRDMNILNLVSNKDDQLFLVAYAILEQRNVL